eukprot:scaffold9423_cov132-Isochrysis_galbana.AAC.7
MEARRHTRDEIAQLLVALSLVSSLTRDRGAGASSHHPPPSLSRTRTGPRKKTHNCRSLYFYFTFSLGVRPLVPLVLPCASALGHHRPSLAAAAAASRRTIAPAAT